MRISPQHCEAKAAKSFMGKIYSHSKHVVHSAQVNMSLIQEINELRKELHLARTQVHDYEIQMAMIRKKKKQSPTDLRGEQITRHMDSLCK